MTMTRRQRFALALGFAVPLFAWLFRAKVRIGLFLYHRGILEAGALRAFKDAGGTFVALKVLDGSTPFAPLDNQALIQEARALGLDVHAWGYHYSRNRQEATAEGLAAGDFCAAHGIAQYYFDAEANDAGDWYLGPDPIAAAEAFRAAFKSRTSARLASAVSPAMPLPGFDVYAPQCYGTASTPQNTADPETAWRRVMTARIASGLSHGIVTEPIFASGRMDAAGQVWSPWTGPDGVLALTRDLGLRQWSFWYGAGSTGRIVTGGGPEPSLAALIPLATQGKTA